MTQNEVAQKLFTSRENISKWERGINLPTIDSFLLLCKLYEIEIEEILFKNND